MMRFTLKVRRKKNTHKTEQKRVGNIHQTFSFYNFLDYFFFFLYKTQLFFFFFSYFIIWLLRNFHYWHKSEVKKKYNIVKILTVDNAKHSSLSDSSLGTPTHGGTAASVILLCCSFMKASCSLLKSPRILWNKN